LYRSIKELVRVEECLGLGDIGNCGNGHVNCHPVIQFNNKPSINQVFICLIASSTYEFSGIRQGFSSPKSWPDVICVSILEISDRFFRDSVPMAFGTMSKVSGAL